VSNSSFMRASAHPIAAAMLAAVSVGRTGKPRMDGE
jgi:hypothetical protein